MVAQTTITISMESIAMLRGGSFPKLPLYAPPSTIPPTARWLRFDLSKSPVPRLAHGSIGVSIKPTRNDKFLVHCRNAHTRETQNSNSKQDPWKSLLSLVPAKADNNSKLSTIVSIKNEALKLLMDEKYDAVHRLVTSFRKMGSANDDVAYEARVIYVQFLIYLDEYDTALDFLEKKVNFPKSESSDARPCLYKAVVRTMLGKDDAKECWNAYLKTLNYGNAHGRFLFHGKNNTDPDQVPILTDAPLKSLLSLKPEKVEEGSSLSNIIPAKNKALKRMVGGKYGTIEHLDSWKKEKDEEAYETQMTYIQILMHLDKYEEALECLKKDAFFVSSDARPYLYKAIVLTVLGNHGEARNWWEDFINTLGNTDFPRLFPG